MPRKGKIFSRCRGKPHDRCLQDPICIYTNGQKYRYCRLSRKYILDKTDKTTKDRITKEKVASFRPPSIRRTNSTAKRKIGKFFKNTTFKRRAHFLSQICQDSNLCLALGKENRKIKAFFNDFQGLEFIEPPIERKGAPSANGFVHRIHYRRNKYDAYAIMKSSAIKDGDNLAYEYLVGKYLNDFQNRFPLFVETYALYSYIDETAWNHTKTTNQIAKQVFFKNINRITNQDITNIAQTCTHSKHLAILIQDIKDPISLKFATASQNFVKHELMNTLFHIYSILHTLRSSFTHYDLHDDNVLLYTLSPDSHIEYVYHVSAVETVKFKSKYMVKIIDYGRSFFPNAKKYHNNLCKTVECNPDCGEDVGYGFMNKAGTLRDQYYIWSNVHNQSHDLRLLKLINEKIKQHKIAEIDTQYAFLNKIIYRDMYGTPEKMTSGLPTKIHNVSDAFARIKSMVLFNDALYATSSQLGVLHIYLDNTTPMRFVPANP